MRKTIWGFALLVIMAFLASCSESSEYTNAIPKDAEMVVSWILSRWHKKVVSMVKKESR